LNLLLFEITKIPCISCFISDLAETQGKHRSNQINSGSSELIDESYFDCVVTEPDIVSQESTEENQLSGVCMKPNAGSDDTMLEMNQCIDSEVYETFSDSPGSHVDHSYI